MCTSIVPFNYVFFLRKKKSIHPAPMRLSPCYTWAVSMSTAQELKTIFKSWVIAFLILGMSKPTKIDHNQIIICLSEYYNPKRRYWTVLCQETKDTIANEIFQVLQRRGAPQRSLIKGTSSRRAHEQSTTASPFLSIKSWSSLDTHCFPTGLPTNAKKGEMLKVVYFRMQNFIKL